MACGLCGTVRLYYGLLACTCTACFLAEALFISGVRGALGKTSWACPSLSGDWSAKPGYVPKPSGQPSWFDAPRCNTPPTYQSASSDNEGR